MTAPKPDEPRRAPNPLGLIGLQGLPAADIRAFLLAASSIAHRAPDQLSTLLRGRIVANLFFEDSTRTRTSFTIAARRLGADVVDLQGSSSSVNKGETLIDTARNVEAMGVSALVVRARQSGAASGIASAVTIPVINAGDGRHEHPTQGLLDAYTIAESFDRQETFDLSGLTVGIIGDVAASRVARSNIAGLTSLGAKVVCIGPPSLVPASLHSLGARVTHNLDESISEIDAVMMLRIQFERYDAQDKKEDAHRGNVIPSVREFREMFALTRERAARLKPGAIVMHPGPINRGLEMDGCVADGPRSVILRQVRNGIAVRMAVLARACGVG